MLGKLAQQIVGRFFISTAYTTGLTLLIPLAILRVFPADLGVVSPGTSPTLVWLAAGMVVLSFFVRVWSSHSVGGALKGLGGLTFIPGFIGLLLSIFGRDALLTHLARTVPRFPQVKDVLELYIDRAVPRVRYLTLAFFVLGVILLLAGDRLEAHARAPEPRQPT